MATLRNNTPAMVIVSHGDSVTWTDPPVVPLRTLGNHPTITNVKAG